MSSRFYFALFSLFFFSCSLNADVGHVTGPARHNADWMSGKIGLSSHYIAHIPQELEPLADRLKVSEIAEQASIAGATWFLFPIYHEYWLMTAPNDTFDRIMGNGDFTSRRDVPKELYNALNKKGIRLMLYVNLQFDPTSQIPALVNEAMGGGQLNDRLVHKIAAIFKEFSLRYGSKVSGWWVDGVQTESLWGKLPKRNRELWFKEIADALRAGNPKAAIAFNPGFASIRYSAQNDYIAGESTDINSVPRQRLLDGVQWHVWTYLGDMWGLGGNRFANGQLLNYARKVTAHGGAMTFEVGSRGQSSYNTPPASPNDGRIDPGQVEQIRFVTEKLHQKPKPASSAAGPINSLEPIH